MGRNKPLKHLEENLDKETPQEKFENLFKQDIPEPKECPHKHYCSPTIVHYPMKCIFNNDLCRVKKFYDRFGEYYNQMGIGGKV